MLDDYAKIQPAVLKDISDAIQKQVAIDQKDDQYRISYVQSHLHTGVDSQQIPFTSIVDSQAYRAFQRITLTPAEVRALNSSPVVLVPAMGANTLIIIEGITGYLSYKGTAYTGADALEFRYNLDASGAVVAEEMPTSFLNSAASIYRQSGADTSYIGLANAPVVAWVDNANPATGNSPITLVVAYRLVSFIQ